MQANPTRQLACIIDDDLIYTNLIKKIIEKNNLCNEFLIFNNGKQSIDYLESSLVNSEEHIPEIIFLDLNMPIMDGWEFLERFNKIKSKIKKKICLYVVSSSINPVDIKRAKSSPTVQDYISKPLNLNKLENILKKCG
ncbi:response regulator [Seonamhaeicola marinus]|uniref:Response regulator n=1 Tax=Seonamhaeicola marinus TaxID=1912246 RepID=A0A5D0HFK1_9FLAO|nr:response regulator [Seonamhaeicola marinus]TYA70174.1 response regulator [Seonamhaeicola marinus]